MLPVLNKLLDRFSWDLAIDLGSTNTLIYRKAKGIVLNEPTAVAFSDKVIRPVRFGMVADSRAAESMLNSFLDRIRKRWFSRQMRVIANIPAETSDRDKDRLRQVIRSVGAREMYLLDQPRALALGSGLDLSEEHANMVLDIGGQITEMAVMVGHTTAFTRTIRVGGEDMNKGITDYLRKNHDLLVDIKAAEKAKIDAGEALPGIVDRCVLTEGVDSATGMPRFIEISSPQVREALSKTLADITTTVNAFLQSLPSDIYVDILDRGITLAGGGAMLRGIDLLIERETGIAVHKTRNPLTCLVQGGGDALEFWSER